MLGKIEGRRRRGGIKREESKLASNHFSMCSPQSGSLRDVHRVTQRREEGRRTKFPKKGNAKECSDYHTIALISHGSKVMLKILQARLQQYVNHEFPEVEAGFRKGRGITDQIANIHSIIEKIRELQKNIYFCFIDYAKAFDCVDHIKLWKILPR